MHSLIIIKFLVIAISAIPAISAYDLDYNRNTCKGFLTSFCGFQNNKSDYVAIDFKVKDENATNEGMHEYYIETESNFKQLMAYFVQDDNNMDSFGVLRHLAKEYLRIIITHSISKIDNSTFRVEFSNTQAIGNDYPRKFSLYIFNKLDTIGGSNELNILFKQISNSYRGSNERKSRFLHDNQYFLDYINHITPLMEFPVTFFCEKLITETDLQSFFTKIRNCEDLPNITD